MLTYLPKLENTIVHIENLLRYLRDTVLGHNPNNSYLELLPVEWQQPMLEIGQRILEIIQ